MFRLTIYYDLNDVSELGERDAMAEKAAGVKSSGSGTMLATMVRDKEFVFATEEALEAAKSRLKDAGFRFIP
jgi:hypothetical protein